MEINIKINITNNCCGILLKNRLLFADPAAVVGTSVGNISFFLPSTARPIFTTAKLDVRSTRQI
jgi:hypothetical protein